MGLKIKQDNKRFLKTINMTIDTPFISSGLRVYSLLTYFRLSVAASGVRHKMTNGSLSHNLYLLLSRVVENVNLKIVFILKREMC